MPVSMVQFSQKLPVLASFGKLQNWLELIPEENQGHLSRERRGNEGVFCSDDRILLGRVAASLVLPLFAFVASSRALSRERFPSAFKTRNRLVLFRLLHI
jgi:hypothetical protein